MSAAKHTPGKWEIHDGGRFGSFGETGPSVCAVRSDGTCQPLFEIIGPADPAEAEANAHLVTAAPDLLAACDDALGFVRFALEFVGGAAFPYLNESVESLRDNLSAAIAKAKGVKS